MTLRTSPSRRRPGLTLLEVIVATLIFLISVAAIWQLSNYSTDRAQDVQFQARTSMRAQGKLAEIMVGAESANSSGNYSNFQEEYDKDLQWRSEISDVGPAGLKLAKVWVKIDLPGGRLVESYVSQMYLDPDTRGTTFDPPPAPATPPSAMPMPTTPSTSGG
jgi:type II secretory pathway pseudopilin PulG